MCRCEGAFLCCCSLCTTAAAFLRVIFRRRRTWRRWREVGGGGGGFRSFGNTLDVVHTSTHHLDSLVGLFPGTRSRSLNTSLIIDQHEVGRRRRWSWREGVDLKGWPAADFKREFSTAIAANECVVLYRSLMVKNNYHRFPLRTPYYRLCEADRLSSNSPQSANEHLFDFDMWFVRMCFVLCMLCVGFIRLFVCVFFSYVGNLDKIDPPHRYTDNKHTQNMLYFNVLLRMSSYTVL